MTASPEIPGTALIELEVFEDLRGSFYRLYSESEVQFHGFRIPSVQTSVAKNPKKGTLRGLHYQKFPHQEFKLVHCLLGSVYDVLLDLRPESPTFRKWRSFVLKADRPQVLVIPPGIAHGYLTLEDDSMLVYHMDEPHNPTSAQGVRWNDSAFGIQWPEPVLHISSKDASFPDFSKDR